MIFTLILLYLFRGEPVFEKYDFSSELKCYETGSEVLDMLQEKPEVEVIVAGCIQKPGIPA